MTKAQPDWAALPVEHRLRVLRRLRHAMARDAEHWALAAAREDVSQADILLAEVLPLLAALRFLERRAAALLAPERRRRGRPFWLLGVGLEVRRLPFGRVLVIGPANYPLLLPAVQAVQALAAGNAVLLKPAPGCAAPARMLAQELARAGLPPGLVTLLEDTGDAGRLAIEAGADLVVLTGASATGRAVLASAAPRLTPTIMELSGEDPFIVLEGADTAYAAKALAFGRAFNAGNTCIAPRRVIVQQAAEAPFRAALAAHAIDLELTVAADQGACVAAANAGPYALGAAIFGPAAPAAAAAKSMRAGCVQVGDIIMPTADPRLPFGGTGSSGFGTTRGPEGLLAMTRPQAIVTRSRPEPRHLTRLGAEQAPLLGALLFLAYGGRSMRTIAAAAARAAGATRALIRRARQE